ncbi:MAG: hypothetical protein KC438_03820 [Thermomicrobiales bacterium]|nr:hypothetical protein [Thermomicrobiales bacterium]MCO5220722.1 hypothetical protein [Thermomicrobiales bacterium]
MNDEQIGLSFAQPLPIELTRRRLLLGSVASAAMAVHLGTDAVAAQATPVSVDPDRLQQLIDLSQTLCGGGNFTTQRATVLYQLIFTDDALESGFEELRANPPAPGQPIEPDLAKATAEVILKFWYADLFAGRPLPDRGSAYYQMTSWQAMYTFSWAVCHFYGGWADEPSTDPLIPANSVS